MMRVLVILLRKIMQMAFCICISLPSIAFSQTSSDGLENQKFAILVINRKYSAGLSLMETAKENLSLAYALLNDLDIPAANVRLLFDADREQFEDVIFDLKGNLREGDMMFVYLHGLSVVLQETQKNSFLLSEFKFLPGSEAFLVQRRLERMAYPLIDLAADIQGVAPVRLTIIYDACAKNLFRDFTATGYQDIVSADACLPTPIPGADVIYGHQAIMPGGVLTSLNQLLNEVSATRLQDLGAIPQMILDPDLATKANRYINVFPDPLAPLAPDTCFARIPGNTCKSLSETHPQTASATGAYFYENLCKAYEEQADFPLSPKEYYCGSRGPETPVTAELAGVSPPQVPPVAPVPAPATADGASTTLDTPPITARPVSSSSFDEVKVITVSQAWQEAKATDTCQAYLQFMHDYKGSLFTLKATPLANTTCSEAEREAFSPVINAPPAPLEEFPAPAAETLPPTIILLASGANTAPKLVALTRPMETLTFTQEITIPVRETAPIITAPAPKIEPEEPTPPPQTAAIAMSQAWQIAKRANTCQGYNEFIEAYPNSPFSVGARERAGRGCLSAEVPEVETPHIPETIPVERLGNENAGSSAGLDGALNNEIDPNILRTILELGQNSCLVQLALVHDYPHSTQAQQFEVNAGRYCEGFEHLVFSAAVEATAQGSALETFGLDPSSQATLPVTTLMIPPGFGQTEITGQTPIEDGIAENRPTLFSFSVSIEDYLHLADQPGAAGNLEALQAALDSLHVPPANRITLRNPTTKILENVAGVLGQEYPEDSNLIVYFSGHSVSLKNSTGEFILGSEFNVPEVRSGNIDRNTFLSNTVSLADLVQSLTQKSAAHPVVFFNACGPNPLPQSNAFTFWSFLRSTSCGNSLIANASVFYPVAQGEVATSFMLATETANRFMQALQEELVKEPSISMLALTNSISWTVTSDAQTRGSAQHPNLVSSLDRSQLAQACVFEPEITQEAVCINPNAIPISIVDPSPPTETGDETPEQPQATSAAADFINAWDEATSTDTCEGYQQFKQDFPNSLFVITAQEGIQRLCDVTPPIETEVPLLAQQYCEEDDDEFALRTLNEEGITLLQTKLNAVGCNVGGADGAWGRRSRAGLSLFLQHTGTGQTGDTPTCGILITLSSFPNDRICPLVCARGTRLENGVCVRVPQAAPVAATPTQRTPTPQPTAPAAACPPLHTLNGEGVCIPVAFRN